MGNKQLLHLFLFVIGAAPAACFIINKTLFRHYLVPVLDSLFPASLLIRTNQRFETIFMLFFLSVMVPDVVHSILFREGSSPPHREVIDAAAGPKRFAI